MPVVEPTKGGYEGVEIPDGLYVVTCKNVEETEMKNDRFGKPDKYRLTLVGVTPDGEPFTVEPLMNRTWSAMPGKTPSTLFTYAEAFGCDPDPNAAFDTDDLLNKKASAFIETAEEEGSWPRVTRITRIKTGASARSTTQPSEKKPGVLLPDGTVDWTLLWKEVKRLGMTRESVAAQFDGDITKLTDMDGIDVAVWLDELQSVTA